MLRGVIVVEVLRTADAPEGLLAQIRALLDHAFDGDFADSDWEHTLGGWHCVVYDGDQLVAHAAVIARTLEADGRRVRAGYVEGVGTEPARQGEQFGTAAMEAAAGVVHEHFALGALSTGEHHFYERLGWERWAGPTYVRAGSDVIRTEDEDDGIMVLRFGASRRLDLTAALSCEARAGDDW